MPNVALGVEDGQSLTFPDEQFDAVLCAMGLMLFPDPTRGLSEFRRVLREGGWAAISVNIVPEQAFVTRVDAIIGRYAPERAAIGARYFCLGDAGLLRSLFAAAGFREVEIFVEARRYPLSSFAAYFKPIEDGQGPTGQAYVALPTEIQQLVQGKTVPGNWREMRPQAAQSRSEVELLFGCGRR